MDDRRLLSRISEASYLEGVAERSIEDLKTMRSDCHTVETEVSYERRLCQARIDILKAELDRRAGKGEGDLIKRLPQVLAARTDPSSGGPVPGRAPDFSIPRSAQVVRRRVDDVMADNKVVNLPKLSSEEINETLRTLREREHDLSEQRKAVHGIMDVVQAEIVRRYQTGQSDPTSALA